MERHETVVFRGASKLLRDLDFRQYLLPCGTRLITLLTYVTWASVDVSAS